MNKFAARWNKNRETSAGINIALIKSAKIAN